MKRPKLIRALTWLLVILLAMPAGGWAQGSGAAPVFKQEELEAILAPIALYPDELLAQVFIGSTYPLEIVEADRFAKANPNLKGDQLTKALEAKNWDPSVKSLVNFPSVLTMMSEKLEWTQKLGDAVIAQEKDVMNTVQTLRQKAQASGNLKTTSEQKVVVQEKTIVIESANPQVVYVPTYNPTVVYGAWPYAAYPPYSYAYPGYPWGAGLAFAGGVALGAAWGYAWGGCNWHGGGGDININNSRNTNINNNIDRGKYAKQRTGGQGGQGKWQHNPEHRKGVSYKDQGSRDKYGQSRPGAENRKDFRGQSPEQGLARGILLVGMPQVVIDHQLLTGEEETWRPAVTRPVGMLVVVGAIQCSPGSQTPLMVWIEAGKTPKCRVIAEAPVARACRHRIAAEVADVEVAEVVSGGGGGGGGGQRWLVAAEVAVAVAAEVAARDNL